MKSGGLIQQWKKASNSNGSNLAYCDVRREQKARIDILTTHL